MTEPTALLLDPLMLMVAIFDREVRNSLLTMHSGNVCSSLRFASNYDLCLFLNGIARSACTGIKAKPLFRGDLSSPGSPSASNSGVRMSRIEYHFARHAQACLDYVLISRASV